MIRPLLFAASVCAILLTSPAGAVLVRSGFFSGMDMTPMQGTTMRQLDGEPAAVLLFSPDAGSTDETTKFDAWFSDTGRPKINAFAVSVGPEETPFEVITEVLRQRELKVPTFHIRGGNLLQGREVRLLLLDNGGQVRRAFDELDLPGLETELGFRRNESAAVTSTNDTGGTITIEEVTSASQVAEPTGPLYRNQPFRMQVEFPPDWTYRVAKSNDGAVAKSPVTGRVDLRIWALADPGATGGPATSPVQYIEDYLEGIEQLNRGRVTVERRLVVEDDEAVGRDYVYTYNRLIDPNDPASGGTRYRGRVQVFVYDGHIKAVAAEGPSGEFAALSQDIIEPFFLSFHPKLEPVVEVERENAPPPSAVPSTTRFF